MRCGVFGVTPRRHSRSRYGLTPSSLARARHDSPDASLKRTRRYLKSSGKVDGAGDRVRQGCCIGLPTSIKLPDVGGQQGEECVHPVGCVVGQ